MSDNTPDKEKFSFEISLSVLNHLGRNLYRSFATVLGEAISNSWDADANNVWIYLSKDKKNFIIKDDGVGMTSEDFQKKFLRIGYSKRRDGSTKSGKGRPYIGRKGIGKLALLSCADKIHIVSKVKGAEYIGGVIDNSGLDDAITEDLTPQQYPLEDLNMRIFTAMTKKHSHGTILYFENLKDSVKNSLEFLRKIIALYFRFSLIDKSFNIYFNGDKIDYKELNALAKDTEFLWKINDYKDPFIENWEKNFDTDRNEKKKLEMDASVKGFIGSVEKPTNLKVMTTEERLGVDLFVNGRLRERDILKHIPTARIAENYLYGQIHFDQLDDKTDRFTSSRESIVAEDTKYKKFLESLRKKILEIVTDWDEWRIKHRKDGDPDNERLTKKERASLGLYNVVSNEYELPKKSKNRKKIDNWVDNLSSDASFNLGSYAECFVSENLVREFIKEKKIKLSKEAKTEVDKWKKTETDNKNKGNISIPIRKNLGDLSYLSMNDMAYMVDKKDPIKEACLARDSNEYKPIRDALAHTSLLTDQAKKKLTSVYENIKGRVKTLLS